MLDKYGADPVADAAFSSGFLDLRSDFPQPLSSGENGEAFYHRARIEILVFLSNIKKNGPQSRGSLYGPTNGSIIVKVTYSLIREPQDLLLKKANSLWWRMLEAAEKAARFL